MNEVIFISRYFICLLIIKTKLKVVVKVKDQLKRIIDSDLCCSTIKMKDVNKSPLRSRSNPENEIGSKSSVLEPSGLKAPRCLTNHLEKIDEAWNLKSTP